MSATVFPSPLGYTVQFFDNNGAVLNGGKLYTYQAGTTTAQATYTDSTGNTAQPNPIVLDSSGRIPNGSTLWLLNAAYKFTLTTSTGSPITTWDNVTPAANIGGSSAQPFAASQFTENGKTLANAYHPLGGSATQAMQASAFTENGALLSNTYAKLGGASTQAFQASAFTENGKTLPNVYQVLIPGMVTLYAGSTIPSGWLICDGSAVSRTTYASLFTALGTTWGVGDGSTTFNLPDLRGRVGIGAGQGGGLSIRILAQTGGEETHLLTTTETPVHNHTITNVSGPISVTSGGNDFAYYNGASNQGPYNVNQGGVGYTGNANFGNVTGTASVTGTSDNAGGGGSHNNMQPYAVLNYIIRT